MSGLQRTCFLTPGCLRPLAQTPHFFAAPRIKALSNEVNKRCHDLETQMRKIDFDAASIFARLDSVEAEPVRNGRGGVKYTYCLGDSFGDLSHPCDLYSHVENLKVRILITFKSTFEGSLARQPWLFQVHFACFILTAFCIATVGDLSSSWFVGF